MTFKEWLELREIDQRAGLMPRRQYIPTVSFGKTQNPFATAASTVLSQIGGSIGDEFQKLGMGGRGAALFPDLPNVLDNLMTIKLFYPDARYSMPGQPPDTNDLENSYTQLQIAKKNNIPSIKLVRLQNEFDRILNYRKKQLVERATDIAETQSYANKIDLNNPKVIFDEFDGKKLIMHIAFHPLKDQEFKDT